MQQTHPARKSLHELKAFIAHPMCRRIWFGYPCGAFGSARRSDGGPKRLRGTNSKDIRVLPQAQGKEWSRVNSGNKLLLGMHELMEMCENQGVPLYIANSQSWNVWMHQILRKWVHHKSSHQIGFGFCQLGAEWKRATTVLPVGNRNFNIGKPLRCKVAWCDKVPIWSTFVKT